MAPASCPPHVGPDHRDHREGQEHGGERPRCGHQGATACHQEHIPRGRVLPPTQVQVQHERPQRSGGRLREVRRSPVQLRDSRYPADGERGSDPGADVMACDQEEHNNRDCRQSHRHQPRNRRRLPGRQQRGMQRGILGGHARFDEDVHLLEEHGDSRRGPAPGSLGEQFRLKQHRAFVVDRARLTPGAPDRRHQRSRHQTEDERRRRMPHDQRGRTNRAKVLHRHPANREQDRQRHQGASQGEQKGRLVHRGQARGSPR